MVRSVLLKMAQLSLLSLFQGSRQAVSAPTPERRRPGRPPKAPRLSEALSRPASEAPSRPVSEVLAEVRASLQQAPLSEALLSSRSVAGERHRTASEAGSSLQELAVALGFEKPYEMRMPGVQVRNHEGPQFKLSLSKWMSQAMHKMSGLSIEAVPDDVFELVVAAVSEQLGRDMAWVRRVWRGRETWAEQCRERGVNETGLLRDESHLPRYLRKSSRSKGVIVRAKGGGRKDELEFLYPLVKEWFDEMRVHGRFVNKISLLEHFLHVLEKFIRDADKRSYDEATPSERAVLYKAKAELAKLTSAHLTHSARDHREKVLMRVVEARLRAPQRLVKLSLTEERGRWLTTLQAYDLMLYESMCPEKLRKLLADPERFVAGIEDLVIVHCDQIPVWIKIGAMKQLYSKDELRSKKAHEILEKDMNAPGERVVVSNEPDGMTQMRQLANGDLDKFRVTLETSQLVFSVMRPTEQPKCVHGRPVLVMPGAHARLSNIDKNGNFIKDEFFVVGNKKVERRAGQSAGALMRTWRQFRDSGDEKIRRYLDEVEIMQQPSAFCDSIVVGWIDEMRYEEGHTRRITVRDMFAGGLSESVKRS